MLNGTLVLKDLACPEAAFCGAFQDREAGLPSLLSYVVNVCVDELYFAVRPTNIPAADFTIAIDSDTSRTINLHNCLEPCGSHRISEAGYEACANIVPQVLKNKCVEGCILVECYESNPAVRGPDSS